METLVLPQVCLYYAEFHTIRTLNLTAHQNPYRFLGVLVIYKKCRVSITKSYCFDLGQYHPIIYLGLFGTEP